MKPINYDILIIGSGLGGLMCAYTLSKNGYRVAICEKNKVMGGCLQVFSRKQTQFSTGMHFIGGLDEGQLMQKYFKYFGLWDHVELKRLDEEGFDRIYLEGKTYRYAMGYERFVDTLAQDFPSERKALSDYVNALKKIAQASPLYNLQEIHDTTIIEQDYVKKSVDAFIASFTQDPLLQNVLAGSNPLYAGIKDKTPVYVHALIMNSYIQSAYRLAGGSYKIAESLVNSIKSFGGDVFLDAEVSRIVSDDTKLTSVVLANGETLFAKNFIANAYPENIIQMIDSSLIRKAYRQRIASIENTVSSFVLYIVFKPQQIPYQNYNLYYYKEQSVWNTAYYGKEQWPLSFLYLHECVSQQGPWAHAAEVICYMRYEDVKAWENTRVGKRGADYEEFKRNCAEKVLDRLSQLYPGFKDSVSEYYTSSPLTYRDYTGTKNGSLYGIQRDCHFPAQSLISARTKIPNLFFTGQNTNAHGFLGVTIGSVITCGEFLGINTLIKDIKTFL